MEFRLAAMEDLTRIQDTYREIIQNMYENQLPIWDDIYPCEFFKADIEQRRLYLMEDQGEIISAFALCPSHPGESHVAWEDPCGKALYLDRLGVHPRYAGAGIGRAMLGKAKEMAKALGAGYLRLFVVDINVPAAHLYAKCGFRLAEGIYEEVIDETCRFYEYGYEIQTES